MSETRVRCYWQKLEEVTGVGLKVTGRKRGLQLERRVVCLQKILSSESM